MHVSALFDEPNLIADAGLLPLVALAKRVGLPDLAATVRIEAADNSGGARAPAKMMSLLGAMCRADSIDDADRLRHGAMGRAFAGIRALSTLGTFLRSFTHGNNRQLRRVHRDFLARLAAPAGAVTGDVRRLPGLPPADSATGLGAAGPKPLLAVAIAPSFQVGPAVDARERGGVPPGQRVPAAHLPGSEGHVEVVDVGTRPGAGRLGFRRPEPPVPEPLTSAEGSRTCGGTSRPDRRLGRSSRRALPGG
ncbi:hypothetical protein ACFVT6_23730 [Streptomyces sp. NPDC058049]|uniref:hypothetical protein n=1 Tax=Streptomyces sp. NPDC058049 TaxID=3346314 RepID=UPI0036E30199